MLTGAAVFSLAACGVHDPARERVAPPRLTEFERTRTALLVGQLGVDDARQRERDRAYREQEQRIAEMSRPPYPSSEDRREYRSTVRGRTEKLDLRMYEVTTKANANTRASVQADVDDYNRGRDALLSRLEEVATAPREHWASLRADVEAKVTGLEALVDRAERRLR